MKKILALLLALTMLLALAACGNTNAPVEGPVDEPDTEDTDQPAAVEETPAEDEAAAEPTTVRIGSLKGPTSIGLAHLRSEAEADESEGSYTFTLEADASALMTGIVNGDLDIALIPANAASIWYNKMEGAVTCINVNTLGVLYMLSADDSVDTIEELAGKTIYLPGQGTSPDYVLQYLLAQHGMTLEDVTVEYQAEGTEVIAALTANPEGIGLLPQPAATAAQSKLEGFSVVMDLTEEWGKVCDQDLITGVTVVRTEFLNENKEAVDLFISEHNESVKYIDADLAGVAQLTEDYGIMDKAALAEKAIPLCNVTEISGEEMKELVSNYLQVLFDLNPASVGGTLPADDFYYLG